MQAMRGLCDSLRAILFLWKIPDGRFVRAVRHDNVIRLVDSFREMRCLYLL